ncbi:MAG: glycerophosphodiester phosphodiesterase [Clostridia bacterium]|nr:glycerophosphodiester phosphodiesterase [Clostridia bacterium]
MLLVFLLIPVVLTGLYVFCLLPQLPRRSMEPFLGRDYAHRGLFDNEGIPENSLPAFRRAADQGFGIELDVQRAADGTLMVFHDDGLERMCGIRRDLGACTFNELRAAHLLDTEELIPTFAEVLQTVRGRVPLIVEIKAGANLSGTCAQVDAALQRYPGLACIESFDPRAVRWFRRHSPQRIRGQLVFSPYRHRPLRRDLKSYFLSAMPGNVLTRPDFIAHEVESARHPAFLLARKLGARTVAWTVRSQKQMDSLRGSWDLQIFDSFVPERRSEEPSD